MCVFIVIIKKLGVYKSVCIMSSFYTYFTTVPGYNAMLINTKEKCNLGDNQIGISITNSDLEACAESCNNNDQCMFFFIGKLNGWCELLKSCSILDTNHNQIGSTYQKIVPGISK